jgi:hypothetical protein
MNETKYTQKEIAWAIEELNKKHPEKAEREQAISLLDSLGELSKFVTTKIAQDKKSGKLKKN